MNLINLKDNEKQPNQTLFNSLEKLFKIERFNNGYLIPQLGGDKWDGHIYVSGATNAGKSYIIKQIVLNDILKRDVIIYSDVKRDPSFKELYESGRAMSIEEAKEIYEPDKLFKDKIIIFDDCTKESCLEIRDHLLEKGRHSNSVVICVNHKLRDWHATKKPMNESKYFIMFPSANKIAVVKFLDDMGLKREVVRDIVNLSNEDGRYLIFHQFNPNAFITQRTIIYI